MATPATGGVSVVLLLGPPGCGKAAHTEILAQHYGFLRQPKTDSALAAPELGPFYHSLLERTLQAMEEDDSIPGIIFDNVAPSQVVILEEVCAALALGITMTFRLEADNVLALMARLCLPSQSGERPEEVSPQNALTSLHDYLLEEAEWLSLKGDSNTVVRVDALQSQVECVLQMMEAIDTKFGLPYTSMSSIFDQPHNPDLRQVTPPASPFLQFVSQPKQIAHLLTRLQAMVGATGRWAFPGGLPAPLDPASAAGPDAFAVYRRAGDGLTHLLLHLADEPVCYLIDRSLQIFSARCPKALMEAGDSLLEGEVMQVPTGHGAFFVMDVLAANGESVMAEPHPSRLARVADQFPAETQLDVLLKTAPPNVLLVTVKAVVPAPQLTRVVQDVAGAAEGRLFYCHKTEGYPLTSSLKRRMEWRPPERPTTLNLRLLPGAAGGFQFYIGRMGKAGVVREVFLDDVNLACQRPEFQNLAPFQRSIMQCVMLKPHVWQIVAPRRYKSLPDAYDSTVGMQQQLPTWKLLELTQGLPPGSLAPKPPPPPDLLPAPAPGLYGSPPPHAAPTADVPAPGFLPSPPPLIGQQSPPHHIPPLAPITIAPPLSPFSPPPVSPPHVSVQPPQAPGLLPPPVVSPPHLPPPQLSPPFHAAPPPVSLFPPAPVYPPAPLPGSAYGTPVAPFTMPPMAGVLPIQIGPPNGPAPGTDQASSQSNSITISPRGEELVFGVLPTGDETPSTTSTSPPLTPPTATADLSALGDSAVLCIGSIMAGSNALPPSLMGFPGPASTNSILAGAPASGLTRNLSGPVEGGLDDTPHIRVSVASGERRSSALSPTGLSAYDAGPPRRSSGSMWAVTLDESLIMGGMSESWDNTNLDSWTPGTMRDSWAHTTPMSTPAPRGSVFSPPPPRDAAELPDPRRYRAPSLPNILDSGGRPKEADMLTDTRFTKTFRDQLRPKEPPSGLSPLGSSPMWALKSPNLSGSWATPSPSHPRGRRNFRDFNNLAKLWLIQTFAPTQPFAVLDLYCRRGSDLHKWHLTAAKFLLGCDPDPALIADAAERAKAKKQTDLLAEFFVGEPFAAEFALPEGAARRRFEVISCMFAIQNAFRDEATARRLFAFVASHLEDGGLFIGTTVDFAVVQRQLAAAEDGHSFGNSEYKICFEGDRTAISEENPLGHRYKFTTFDEDGEWEEFLVLPGKLIQLAEEAGLQLSTAGTRNFGELGEEQRGKGREIWNQMGLAERELVGLYTTFMFTKP